MKKNEIEILMLYRKDIFLSKTIREISIALKKSYPKTFEAVKSLEKMNIIKIKKAGKSSLCGLNMEQSTIPFMAAIEYENRPSIPAIEKIKIKNPFHCLIITGSYAEGKQKPSSDLDIAIIIPNTENKRPYQTALKEGELTIPQIHGFVFTQEEFQQMLTNEEFNYGKELAKKHIILYGAEAYYKMVFEAEKHGFKG